MVVYPMYESMPWTCFVMLLCPCSRMIHAASHTPKNRKSWTMSLPSSWKSRTLGTHILRLARGRVCLWSGTMLGTSSTQLTSFASRTWTVYVTPRSPHSNVFLKRWILNPTPLKNNSKQKCEYVICLSLVFWNIFNVSVIENKERDSQSHFFLPFREYRFSTHSSQPCNRAKTSSFVIFGRTTHRAKPPQRGENIQ